MEAQKEQTAGKSQKDRRLCRLTSWQAREFKQSKRGKKDKWLLRLDSDQSMVLTALDVTGFIAMRPTNLDKNAFFGQPICHM
jgi:hypothetical protein